MADKIILATVDNTGWLTGVGRAPKAVIVTVKDKSVVESKEVDVDWDEKHEKEEEGLHHANIAKFILANKITDVVAAGVGPDMRRMLERLGVKLHLASGDYLSKVNAIAEE